MTVREYLARTSASQGHKATRRPIIAATIQRLDMLDSYVIRRCGLRTNPGRISRWPRGISENYDITECASLLLTRAVCSRVNWRDAREFVNRALIAAHNRNEVEESLQNFESDLHPRENLDERVKISFRFVIIETIITLALLIILFIEILSKLIHS